MRPDPRIAERTPASATGRTRADHLYVRYTDEVEVPEPDEDDLIGKIIDRLDRTALTTRSRYKHAYRVSHAKSYGLLKGELHIRSDLPDYLSQGLFSSLRWYPVMVRLAQMPGEPLDDRRVSTPRGMAIKILNVDGSMLPNHETERTQDLVLSTGKIFPVSGLRSFLALVTGLQTAAYTPEYMKGLVSASSQTLGSALREVGVDLPNLDLLGHPPRHPLTETYYSQAPIRYGDYIAKLAVTPSSPLLRVMRDELLPLQDEDSLRHAVVNYFEQHSAEFEVQVQLCTDVNRMPIENTFVEWSETESPYQTVATLYFPKQHACTLARRRYVDEQLLFCPAHSLAAHRPLGGIMRARMKAYEVLGNRRRRANEQPLREPQSLAEMPD